MKTASRAKCGRMASFASSALRPWPDFNTIKSPATYPAGAVLFLEKQDPRGVFVLCAGQVKLSISSSAGKTLILRIAKPGEILGLMATMSGSPYEVTAETLHPCQVAFVRRDDFLHFVGKHPEVYQGVVRQLSTLYSGACEQLRTVGLSTSAPEKLARLLLEWSPGAKDSKQGRTDQAASDPRRDCRIHRHHTRNRDADAQRIQKPSARCAAGFDPNDFQSACSRNHRRSVGRPLGVSGP